MKRSLAMEKRYDLFELPAGGFPRWLDSASNLAEATDKMIALSPPSPGSEYLVRDFYSGRVVAYTLPKKPEPASFTQSTLEQPAGMRLNEVPVLA
jgi:hypothetical protein